MMRERPLRFRHRSGRSYIHHHPVSTGWYENVRGGGEEGWSAAFDQFQFKQATPVTRLAEQPSDFRQAISAIDLLSNRWHLIESRLPAPFSRRVDVQIFEAQSSRTVRDHVRYLSFAHHRSERAPRWKCNVRRNITGFASDYDGSTASFKGILIEYPPFLISESIARLDGFPETKESSHG